MTEPATSVGVVASSLQGPGVNREVVDGDWAATKAEQTRTATESSPGIDSELIDNNNDDAPVKKLAADETQRSVAPDKSGASSSEAREHWRAVQAALGDFLETVEAQVGLVLLIAVDICASAALIYIQTRHELIGAYKSRGVGLHDLPVSGEYAELGAAVVARVLGAFSTLAIGVYVLELVVLLAVFKRQFIAHSGYTFDAVLVAATISIEVWTESKAVRLLGIMRVWRVFRVVSTVVECERAAHDASKNLLELERASTVQLQMEKLAAEESLKREYASRTGLERLLYDYKDEVATLKEALEIAAQAVAEAEMLNAQQPASSIDPVIGMATAVGDEQQYISSGADVQGQQAYPPLQGTDGSTYCYDTDAYAYYQQTAGAADTSTADEEKLPAENADGDQESADDPESDFEDAIQSDGEPLGQPGSCR